MKLLDATCSGETVLIESVPVDTAEILSEGVGASQGVAIIQDEKVVYFTSNAADIKTTLEKLIDILTELTSGLTTLDAKPVGGSGSAPAPAIASNISQITSIQAELALLKDALK